MGLNIEDLGKMIADKRHPSGLRAAAKEIGISAATLSRIENGHVPDLTTFAAICDWLGEDPAQFLGMQNSGDSIQTASVHLRKKTTTSIDTANALGGLILAAQNALVSKDSL